MTIYCDESGGVGAGVMTLAAASLAPDMAAEMLQRVRDVLGLRRELKGSRIDIAERAFVIELFMRMGGRAVVATAAMADLRTAHGAALPADIAIYAALLESATEPYIAASGGCISIEIDDGRYDARLNGMLRREVQSGLGQWGQARLADSKRSPGVQIADVLANSLYQIGIASPRTSRIEALLAPFIATGELIVRPLQRVDALSNSQPS